MIKYLKKNIFLIVDLFRKCSEYFIYIIYLYIILIFILELLIKVQSFSSLVDKKGLIIYFVIK